MYYAYDCEYALKEVRQSLRDLTRVGRVECVGNVKHYGNGRWSVAKSYKVNSNEKEESVGS